MDAGKLVTYFKKEGANETLCRYIENAYVRLQDGHVITEINSGDEEKIGSDLVSMERDVSKPFLIEKNQFYFQKYFKYESDIVHWIQTKMKQNKYVFKENLKYIKQQVELVKQLFPTQNAGETDWQAVGAVLCFLNAFAVVSGGPGTGKTRTVARFLALYFKQNPQAKVALVAQTGKAAARLKESLANQQNELSKILGKEIASKFNVIEPSTIHRFLGYDRNSLGAKFNYHANNQLSHDLILIDEASMIDLPLMAKMLNAIKPEAKVVMMGDMNQLCSVEAGSVFGDICGAMKVNGFSNEYVTLFNLLGIHNIQFENSLFADVLVQFQKSYRFSDDKPIGKFSKQVLEGNLNLDFFKDTLKENKQGVQCIEQIEDKVFKQKLVHYEAYCREEDVRKALKLINKIKILSSQREGVLGVERMNKLVEQYLMQKELIQVSESLYHNQPIMILQNDYSLDLFNGDIGLIRKENEVLYFYIEDAREEIGYRQLPADLIRKWQTVYAMTIHKSQGSEFEQVIIVMPQDVEAKLLSRELLYTAVTRSSHHVLLIGVDEVIQKATKTKIERSSGIKERLS